MWVFIAYLYIYMPCIQNNNTHSNNKKKPHTYTDQVLNNFGTSNINIYTQVWLLMVHTIILYSIHLYIHSRVSTRVLLHNCSDGNASCFITDWMESNHNNNRTAHNNTQSSYTYARTHTHKYKTNLIVI